MKKFSSILLFLFCISLVVAQNKNQSEKKKTGTWNATIPVKNGFERIDFFSNHVLEVNGYKQYFQVHIHGWKLQHRNNDYKL